MNGFTAPVRDIGRTIADTSQFPLAPPLAQSRTSAYDRRLYDDGSAIERTSGNSPVSQTFVRCPHCGMPHQATETVCNVTGKAISVRPAPMSGPSPMPTSKGRPHPPESAQPTSSSLSAQIPIGSLLESKYEIISRLGQGGMGTVYEAVHRAMRRVVAVKVLSRRQSRKRDALVRFHHEAQAAAAIGHPNICEVYDFGKHSDGRPFIVMERLYGFTLADRIAAEGALPFEDTISIMAQVLLGLEAAHAKHIVHRDIKPENVFLCKRPGSPTIVKILDFGVSKFVSSTTTAPERKDDSLSLTRTGIVMGTPYYMSPEQARGERAIDARVDIYACGVMLYEALTGKRPFLANNYNALMVEIVTREPARASSIRPALPGSFDRVIATAMSKQRDDRYQSAEQFREALLGLRDKAHRRGAPVALGDALDTGPEPTERIAFEPEDHTEVDVIPRFDEDSNSDLTTRLYERDNLRKPPGA